MANFFFILTATYRNKLPISSRIIDYFQNFVIENILSQKNILLGSKYDTCLSIMLLGEGRYSNNVVEVFPPQSVSGPLHKVKVYSVKIPTKPIIDSDKKSITFAKLLYEGVCLFFIQNFKTIDLTFMDNLWSLVDIEYINSIPYPAPLSEVKYVN